MVLGNLFGGNDMTPDERKESPIKATLLDMLFGPGQIPLDNVPENVQAAVQPPLQVGLPSPVKGAASATVKGLGKAAKGLGKVGKVLAGPGLGAAGTAAILKGGPMIESGVMAGANVLGAGPSKSERENTRKANLEALTGISRLGGADVDQEVVANVSSASGMSLLQDQPAGQVFRADLGELQDVQQQSLLRQAGQLGAARQIMGEQQAMKSRQMQDLSAQLSALAGDSGPSEGEVVGAQLAALLGIGLPAAITGNVQAAQQAQGLSAQIAQQAAGRRAAAKEEVTKLESSIAKLNKDLFDQNLKLGDAEGKLSSRASANVKELQSIQKENLKLEDEGRLDPSQRIRLGNTRFDNVGVSLGDKKLFREAGAPKLSNDAQKRLAAIAALDVPYKRDLQIMQEIILKVGTQADPSLAEIVEYTDPITGEIKRENAGAVLKTLNTRFKAREKDINALGALGQDVLEFTGGLLSDPTGLEAALKDVSGGQSEVIVSQINTLLDGFELEKGEFLKANGIKSVSELNAGLVEELPNFQSLASPINGKSFKYNDPETGRVYLLNQDELDEVFKNARNKRRK